MRLSLLVPELIWPEPADQFTLGKLAAPGLEGLLAHASCQRRPAQACENSLLACCQLDDTPLAALRLLGEGVSAAASGHWLCADPVHLRFHNERIVLADAGAFELTDDEAHALLAALAGEFADIGEFRFGDTRRWYLRLHTPVEHAAQPLSAVAGRRLDTTAPKQPLTRWQNEVQMFLHGQPVNAQRESRGQPAVNSLWLWGGGSLPASGRTPFSAIFGNGPLPAGIARHSGTPGHALPAGLDGVLATGGAQPLVVLDALLPRVLYEDGDGWRSTLETLDRDWFTPLRQALGRKIDEIRLIAPTVYGELHYTITAGARWKFWKKPRPLADIAHALAGEKNA